MISSTLPNLSLTWISLWPGVQTSFIALITAICLNTVSYSYNLHERIKSWTSSVYVYVPVIQTLNMIGPQLPPKCHSCCYHRAYDISPLISPSIAPKCHYGSIRVPDGTLRFQKANMTAILMIEQQSSSRPALNPVPSSENSRVLKDCFSPRTSEK